MEKQVENVGVTLLRKLTRKSTMKFGQFGDCCVQELLNKYKYDYLRWVYYNCSKITFTDDILDEINIPVRFRIDKPSIDSSKHEELRKELLDKMSETMKNHINLRVAKNKKIKADKCEAYVFKKNSAARLTSINHGHR